MGKVLTDHCGKHALQHGTENIENIAREPDNDELQ
jgi:hypothetical protein